MAKTILVVDDEPGILRLIEYQLQSEGYQVLTAVDGAEALGKAQGQLPDLMILDVMLPDMSGTQVCERLRSQPKTADLPIIMLSARAQVQDKVIGLQAGADDYVTKPVEMPELIARIEVLLSRARRLQDA
jgi:DNA-binding response OmpR family regulator